MSESYVNKNHSNDFISDLPRKTALKRQKIWPSICLKPNFVKFKMCPVQQ
jgi:hypothetical protein